MNRPDQKKKRIIIIASATGAAVALTALALFLWYRKPIGIPFIQPAEVVTRRGRMNVFVHGTFGTALGMLSMFNVMQDEVRGTIYHKVTKRMRKDPYFYKDQPILERGLVGVTPTFDITQTAGMPYAAYPLTKAYDTINRHQNDDDEVELYYTFGWTGLISQIARRNEAIRFYNALVDERDRLLQNENFDEVLITLIGHSHAGNMMLNLALINEVLGFDLDQPIPENASANKDKLEALKKMHTEIAGLPDRAVAAQKRDQKKFDFQPEQRDLIVDELIMLGTPIQPETDHCAVSGTFNQVFNFYSDEDVVQRMDWVSTKEGVSKQRFETREGLPMPHQRITQARLKMGGPDGHAAPRNEQTKTFWQRLLSGVPLFSKMTDDPDHRELWFLSWQADESKSKIAPLPAAVLTPFFIKTIRKSGLQDVDLIITVGETDLVIGVREYSHTEVATTSSLPLSLINSIKEHVMKWKPTDLSYETEFAKIHQYSQEP